MQVSQCLISKLTIKQQECTDLRINILTNRKRAEIICEYTVSYQEGKATGWMGGKYL